MPAAERPRPDLATDLVSAFLLLLLSVGGAFYAGLTLGLRAWAASSSGVKPTGSSALPPPPPPYDWVPVLTVGALALWLLLVTGFAWYGRLRVTAVLHGLLLAAVLLLVGVAQVQEQRNTPPPKPAPLPSDYHPCFSGSGRCN
ncbi:DUF6234 family protein [Kitasatospora sp. NPDC002040]|uniref:DUF6234 family protein n=1 Tax=Kitasatospora sp. NPDC002040 TaxID=3154661 RepID=UPI003328AB4B